MRLEQTVLQILSDSTVEGNVVKLNSGTLDRNTYLSVNKSLEYIGGKWNRKLGGHIFNSDPTELLEHVILTGSVDKPETNSLNFFPTPNKIVKQMIDLVGINSGMSVLEPSAGQGAILEELSKLGCKLSVVEIESINRKILEDKGFVLHGHDFLKYQGSYDRIVMNPPFVKQADIDHVLHAFDLLNKDGILVSVMSAGIKFRTNKKTLQLKNLIDINGEIIDLPEDSFKESGTRVNTVLVVLKKCP